MRINAWFTLHIIDITSTVHCTTYEAQCMHLSWHTTAATKKNTQENAIAKTISINLLFKFPTFSNVNKPTPLYNNNVTETTLFGIIIHNTVQYKQFWMSQFSFAILLSESNNNNNKRNTTKQSHTYSTVYIWNSYSQALYATKHL